jgi:L-alanine-DL-glutamate epimerase-like enolase superfamily enzyme
MKVSKLEDFHADGGWDTYSFLKITTDEGLAGWSEYNESRRRGMTALIHGLGTGLIGKDPREIAKIEAALYATTRPTGGGLSSHAIGAIVNACLPYFEHHAVDVAIIDPQWNGLTESMRMAAMADAYDVNVASHNFNGPLANVMGAHFCAAVPNFRIMEFDADEVPWKAQLITNPYVIEDGEMLLPTGAGWGTEVNEAVVRAHPARM